MFQIPKFTQARVASITNRVEKHGDDEKPAVSLSLEIEAENTILDQIDPKIREALFKPKPDEEPELPGVEQSTPVLRCNSIDRVTLPTKHEGWTLGIDAGIGGDAEPMKFGSVKADKFSVEPKQGGSIVLRLRVGTSDVDAERLGWLGMHNGEDIWITLLPPEPKPEAIDGTVGHPGAQPGSDAGELFAAEHGGPDDEPSEGGDPDASGQASKDALDASGHNPFGGGGGPVSGTVGGPATTTSTRTARGREATRKALAEGAAAHAAAGAA
jgi:hypothetical protein